MTRAISNEMLRQKQSEALSVPLLLRTASDIRVPALPGGEGVDVGDRMQLLRSYVDLMVLRDVIERHGVSNVEALRRLQRHLLSNPAAPFSVSKFHRDLRSQGIAVEEETLHLLLGYLEDAFLVRLVSMHTASERQRTRNARKAYPIDPGLIPVYERAGRENVGRSLEAVILLELERRGYEMGWVRTGEDLEVDFYAEPAPARAVGVVFGLRVAAYEAVGARPQARSCSPLGAGDCQRGHFGTIREPSWV